MPIKSWQSKY